MAGDELTPFAFEAQTVTTALHDHNTKTTPKKALIVQFCTIYIDEIIIR